MEMIRLKYLCSSFSTPITQDEISEQNLYPVYGAGGLVGYKGDYACDKDYLGIIKDGAGVGRVNVYSAHSSLLGTMAYIVPNTGVDLPWLKYAVMGLDLGKDISSTTIPHIYFKDYGNREVARLSESTQSRIAAFLDRKCAEIDRVVAETEKTIEEYKALKQSIITEAVTHGVRGKRPMKDSGIEWIGEIPAEWEIPRIKNIIQQSKEGIKIGPFGSALTNKTIENGEYNVYSQANLIAGDYSSTKHTVSTEVFVNLISYEVFPGDICLSMMGTIGKCKIVPYGINRGIMDSHLIKIRLSDCVVDRYFEYVYDKDLSGICYAQMQFDKKGFIMDGLNTTIVKNLCFPLPSVDEQIEILSFLDFKCAEIGKLIAAKQQLLTELEAYKKSVIYEYVTGKKEVPACQ